MATLTIPFSVTYQTEGVTPIRDVVAALQAADSAIHDGVSLLSSFVPAIVVEGVQVNLRSVSQESPLREAIFLALYVAAQNDLEREVPQLIQEVFGYDVSEYKTIVTLVVMIVIFYGAAFIKDLAVKAASESDVRNQLEQLISELSERTGRTKDEIKRVLDAKYNRPKLVKRLIVTARDFFLPSHREGGTDIIINDRRIDERTVRDIPISGDDVGPDLDRYRSFEDVQLELHAQDRDKTKVGWAAVPAGLSDRRIKLRIIPPLTAKDLWGKDHVIGDGVILSKLTSDGYKPSEIHLTHIRQDTDQKD